MHVLIKVAKLIVATFLIIISVYISITAAQEERLLLLKFDIHKILFSKDWIIKKKGGGGGGCRQLYYTINKYQFEIIKMFCLMAPDVYLATSRLICSM